MKKTLYSLMLSDEVIREIDRLAHRMGTNRSNLVNQILAEHVSLRTPEQQMDDIFAALHRLMSPSRDIVPMYEQGAASMSLKSCLEYKYRPTVRYEVELERGMTGGTLSVVFRTQSAALLDVMSRFFALWTRIENAYLPSSREYALADGRFVRTLQLMPDMSAEEAAAEISEYVRFFDGQMKGFVGGQLTGEDIAAAYAVFAKNVLI